MKRCRDCGKIVFACCGNEPGDYCYRCEERRDDGGAGAESGALPERGDSA